MRIYFFSSYFLEIPGKIWKSLITHLPAGRQGLWNDWTDKKHIENGENLFNHFLKSMLSEVFDIISTPLLETSFFDISRLLDYVLRYYKKNSGIHRFWRRNKDKGRGQDGRQPAGSLYQGYRWGWEEVLQCDRCYMEWVSTDILWSNSR